MAKLSRRADLSYNTIQALCKDPYHDVNLGTLQKIADALHITVFDLLEEVPTQETQ
jgi:DNA-binding Xre family transcriptional regulator